VRNKLYFNLYIYYLYCILFIASFILSLLYFSCQVSYFYIFLYLYLKTISLASSLDFFRFTIILLDKFLVASFISSFNVATLPFINKSTYFKSPKITKISPHLCFPACTNYSYYFLPIKISYLFFNILGRQNQNLRKFSYLISFN